MIEKTQYNDVIGTVAGDFNNDNAFIAFCIDCKIDVKKFKPIGLRLVNSYNDVAIYIQAIQLEDGEEKLVQLETDCKIEDFLHLFKSLKLSVCLQTYFDKYANRECEKTISLKPQKETIVL